MSVCNKCCPIKEKKRQETIELKRDHPKSWKGFSDKNFIHGLFA